MILQFIMTMMKTGNLVSETYDYDWDEDGVTDSTEFYEYDENGNLIFRILFLTQNGKKPPIFIMNMMKMKFGI